MTTTHVYTTPSGESLCGATDDAPALFWDPQVSVVMPYAVNCRACRWKAGGQAGEPPVQCGRTFPHLPPETTAGNCPGLLPPKPTAEDQAHRLHLGDRKHVYISGESVPPTGLLVLRGEMPPAEDLTAEGALSSFPPADAVDYWAPRPSYADLIDGLTSLARPGCQNFTTGALGLCPHNGLAERLWCPPCTAYITLNPRPASPGPSVMDHHG